MATTIYRSKEVFNLDAFIEDAHSNLVVPNGKVVIFVNPQHQEELGGALQRKGWDTTMVLLPGSDYQHLFEIFNLLGEKSAVIASYWIPEMMTLRTPRLINQRLPASLQEYDERSRIVEVGGVILNFIGEEDANLAVGLRQRLVNSEEEINWDQMPQVLRGLNVPANPHV